LGLTCALLIVLYTKDEFTFDRFHRDVSSIFVITIDVRSPDGSWDDMMNETGVLQGPRFQASIPELESYTRSTTLYKDIQFGGNVESQLIMAADASFFSMFTFPLLQGDPLTALKQPNSVVISEDAAMKHFGTTDALNKTIPVEKDGEFKPYVVTGVAKRCPQNSSIQFDLLFPLRLILKPEEEQSPESWASLGVNTFVKLRPGSDIQAVAGKMQTVFNNESKEIMDKVKAQGFDLTFHHGLQPLTDVHLDPDKEAGGRGLAKASSPIYAYVLSGIALFILTIATINFINLTLARSVRRAKEIGIRKVIGGARKQLVVQFLGESFLICCLSFTAAMIVAQLLLPWFNDVVNKQLSFSYLLDVKLVAMYLGLFLLTGLLAGFYPAMVLSGYNPVQVLYNQFQLRNKTSVQKILIVFQFTLATVMIIATFVISQQFIFLTTKDLGYNSDHLVEVNKRNMKDQEAKIFRNELLKNPNITLAAPQARSEMNAKINGDTIQHFMYWIVDENFINLLALPVVQGRNFSQLFPSDSSKGIIVNEAFVKMAHWKDPIGQKIKMFLYDGQDRTVIGVIKDYHFASLSEKIKPQALAPIAYPDNPFQRMLVRIKPNSESVSLAYIEKVYKKLFPLQPYSYQFTDEINRQLYKTESKAKTVILFGALMTIFIACMGLFGLSILIAEKKFKEIGIRKVLGASVKAITLALSKEFVGLIVLALIFAIPLAYYAAGRWLETYPYRVEINSTIFISTALLVLMVTLLTTGFHSVKAASMNPVDALRRE
jgi:putative ABC transport system permease protein